MYNRYERDLTLGLAALYGSSFLQETLVLPVKWLGILIWFCLVWRMLRASCALPPEYRYDRQTWLADLVLMTTILYGGLVAAAAHILWVVTHGLKALREFRNSGLGWAVVFHGGLSLFFAWLALQNLQQFAESLLATLV